ncbi:NUDIX domain-containing protein [Deinococcus metallilatus]|uniref:Bifunctional NMN adenylyltransferase/nudix hydrolase n=1 Tax=Deinococcus metallilatus TaxID=1211322 RepID=A0AAJ5JXP3_9DEIO|nr:bifunctional nicotinamide-nucleotide adenylyltransferase/Nudix hydroxylase [Deinococcus metallilatus]MBB5296116.1 bifunctional NMN adenylyltransferase/nudix hydrolase [Deinococcus metallilatus]QBY09829.1 NUDIX domain-containing protein [Deinococcus metallilatus]RXJ08826.1 NUDIX domain-containing protein [Deinococcus metallilatus]TLK23306.1 NUDIX domain-containing protein [Deinococcus metallilatus]GMA13982.1 bifunctional nicotinamide mononucleotide adenylyltransferase/ADP-ribose pyrophosphat
MTAPHDPALASPPPRNRKRTFGVYIGRFEPPHQAHLLVMLEALEQVQKLIVVIGSARAARNTKNPFTAEERQEVITAMLLEAGAARSRFCFVQVRDSFYNEGLWLSEVQRGVAEHTRGSTDIALIGHLKDESSYYLRSFPAWEFIPTHVISPLSATDVRKAYFEDRLEDVQGMVPPAVHAFLTAFRQMPEYAELRTEYDYLREYRAAWRDAPFPPVFVTADAVVTRSGHVLVVRLAGLPGRGRLAMPGGFLQPDETLLACAARRTSSETGLGEAVDLAAKVRSQAVFDHPGRSQRGRTVTHAFHFDLGIGQLPVLKAAEGAAEAFWMPFSQALAQPELFFEDHHAIIEHFLLRG